MSAQAKQIISNGSAINVTISSLAKKDHNKWDEFVSRHPDATFFHRAGWQIVINAAFGHQCHYLMATQGKSVVGVLPLVRLKSLLFGDALISTPFCVYGGVLAETVEVRHGLERAACKLADKLNVDYLEFRNRKRSHPDWPCKDLYVTFKKNISVNERENLLAIPKKQRAMVRKGISNGLRSQGGEVDELFECYSESVRNLGTPVFSKNYFKILTEVFGEDCKILTVRLNGTLVSSVMSFYFRDEVLPYYGGGTKEARSLKGNDFLYWELMRRSAAAGIRIFDYGRSKQDSGSYRFKKHWGFKPEPLFYEYYLVRAQRIPDLSPSNSRYKLLIETWKRLPLWISNRLGPMVSRYLG